MSESIKCINLDTVIFAVVCWTLHYYEVCWLGFCFNGHDYKRHHQHRMSVASFIFFTTVALVASIFNWWTNKLGNRPKGIFNLIYKIWVGALVYNFAERLIWFPLYEVVSYFLEYIAEAIIWISRKSGSETCQSCLELIKGDCIHQIVLALLTLYFLNKFMTVKECMRSLNHVTTLFKGVFSKGKQSEQSSTQKPSCLRAFPDKDDNTAAYYT